MNTLLTETTVDTTVVPQEAPGHPPQADHQVVTLPDAERLRRLPAGDRVALRIGLWLLERGLREPRPVTPASPERVLVTEARAITMLTFDLQQRLR